MKKTKRNDVIINLRFKYVISKILRKHIAFTTRLNIPLQILLLLL